MATITVLNGTNVPINACISAAFNKDWINKLNPGEYYNLDGGPAGVFTLHTNMWAAGVEFESSWKDIMVLASALGMGTLGVLSAVAGILTIPVPLVGEVASGPLLLAATTLLLSVAATISVALTVKLGDFTKTVTSQTGVQALNNPKYIFRGTIPYKVSPNKTGHTKIEFSEVDKNDPFRLERMPDQKFLEVTGQTAAAIKPSFAEYNPNRDTDGQTRRDNYMTRQSLITGRVLNTPSRIMPAAGGDAGWEIENDSRQNMARIQLQARGAVKEALWKIVFVNTIMTNDGPTKETAQVARDVFAIVNSAWGESPGEPRFATLIGEKLVSFELAGEGSFFYILRSGDNYVFKSTRGGQVLIVDNGNTGNGTGIRLKNENGPHFAWAEWKIDNDDAKALRTMLPH